jgi:predicted dithiol-disulfide oxidoreductase (DUF899 family)
MAVRDRVVSRETWLEARCGLLAREKALMRERDALAQARRALPWVKIEKDYRFEGESGPLSLDDLFVGRGQLVVYHFMFGPDWEEGCKSCSFWTDGFDSTIAHLANRDVTFALASRAPLPRLLAFRRRMGWRVTWVSSLGGDFNQDFAVSFVDGSEGERVPNYNFGTITFSGEEAPGLSVFAKGGDGSLFHTYSCYARGLDALNPTYQLLDLVPKGRDEDGLPYPMAWVRHHDSYGV